MSTPNELLLLISMADRVLAEEGCNYRQDLIALASSLPVLDDISSVGGNSLDAAELVPPPLRMWLDTLANCSLH